MDALKIEVLRKIGEQKRKTTNNNLYLNCVFTERPQANSRRYIGQMDWQSHTAGSAWHTGV